jgi:hypothetical protein
VHILETTEDLVEEVLDELLLKRSRGKQSVEISTEKLGDEVNVLKRRDEDVAEGDDLYISLDASGCQPTFSWRRCLRSLSSR